MHPVPLGAERDASRCVRVAASADLHAGGDDADRGCEVDEARAVADACRGLPIPVVAVLGNHDWQSDRSEDVGRALGEAGVVVLERAHTILPVRGASVGIAAVKGFVGGFTHTWANFGEPLFRAAYAETTADVEALDRGLRAIAGCNLQLVLLHYSPTEETLEGEPEQLWLVLGAERLAGPIREHRPHLVVHGHAHRGSFGGHVAGVPVHNVAVHVTGKSFWIFELDADRAEEPVVVEVG